MYFGDKNQMRTASSFFELTILAASFLLVTTRELNNSVRPPFVANTLSLLPSVGAPAPAPLSVGAHAPLAASHMMPPTDPGLVIYLQSSHWKIPPDDALKLIARHLESRYPQEQLETVVMDKLLVCHLSSLLSPLFSPHPSSGVLQVEWKRLVISEFRNGFPASAPTLPSSPPAPPALNIIPSHELPKYELSYFVSPLQSLIGLRPVVFENWHHSLLFHPRRPLGDGGKKSQPPQEAAAAVAVTSTTAAAAVLANEPASSSNPKTSSSSNHSSSTKTKLKFMMFTEKEYRHHALEIERYGNPILSPASPFPQIPPNNPSDFIFINNSWIHSTIVPSQYLKELSPPTPPPSPPHDGDGNGDDRSGGEEVDSQKMELVNELTDENKDGDKSDVLSPNKPNVWRHTVSCVLCKGEDENSLLGRLLIVPSRGQWIHSNCLKCSEGIYETSEGVFEGSEFLLKT
jgi:hypothetical protein